MAKVRSVTYGVSMNVPIAGTMSVALSALLRDILPDQPFRVSTILVSLRHQLAAGDIANVVLAKNVPAAVPWLIDTGTTTHGIIAYLELVKVSAEGTFDDRAWVIPFTEPLDFDSNDSLNLVAGGTSTAIAVQQIYVTLTLEYAAG